MGLSCSEETSALDVSAAIHMCFMDTLISLTGGCTRKFSLSRGSQESVVKYTCKVIVSFKSPPSSVLLTLHHRIISSITLLPSISPSLLAPREVHNRHSKERIRRLHNTRQHVIPRNEGSDHSKHATCPCQANMRVSVGGVARIQVRCSKADERNPYHHEE